MTDRGLIQREGRTKKGGEELEFSGTEEREIEFGTLVGRA
jgi:hypothetical protein